MGFASDLRALCERAGDKAEMVVRGTALELGSQMVDRSPVDTGRFKNNWVTATGTPDASHSAEPDVSGARSSAMLREKIAGWKPGQTIWILNNLPYAKRLEYSGSKQAPGGMVRLAVQNYSQAIKKVADQVRGT